MADLASIVHELLQLLLAIILLGDQAGGPRGLGTAIPCASTYDASLRLLSTSILLHGSESVSGRGDRHV